MPAYLLDCNAAEAVVMRERVEFDTEQNVIEW